MNLQKVFNHHSFGHLPVLIVNGIEWFGATEAAKALTFSNPHKAIDNHVDSEDCMVHTVPTSGGTQLKKFINESGLYSLIFGAAKQGNNPDIQKRARTFKRWVTNEVLPSIRKTGSYSLQDPQQLIALALVEANKLLEAQAEQIAIMKPKADFFDQVASSKDAIDIGTAAKVLKLPGVGRNRLFELLRQEKILMSNNQPYQTYIDRGYFRVVEQRYTKPDGSIHISIKTLVYQKGLDFIRKRINEVVRS